MGEENGVPKLNGFEMLCPPGGESRVVVYTTTLRWVRKTYEDCTAVRYIFQSFGVPVSERDISADRSFREELNELMKGKDRGELVPPRVFVRGRYLGGFEEVGRIFEDNRLWDLLGQLLKGLPRLKIGVICGECKGLRFLPCLSCDGTCKKKEKDGLSRTVVVRCPDCNENGLVLCPQCS